MAIETRYDGIIGSDIWDAQTTDGMLIIDLLQKADAFVAQYNRIKSALLSFIGYETTKPDADMVAQMTVMWQRFSEFGKPDTRHRTEFQEEVTTGLEGYQTAIEWTDFAEVLQLPSKIINKHVEGVVAGDLLRTTQQLWEQYFDKDSRSVEDLKLKKLVTQLPFYNGDSRVPPRVGTKVFTSPHNHYLRSATQNVVVSADIAAGLNTVAEHGFESQLYVVGTEATIADVAGIGDDFAKIQVISPFIPSDMINANQPGALMTTFIRRNPILDVVGVYKGRAQVGIMRDIPEGYIGFFSHEGEMSPDNPLQVRLPEEATLRNLRRVASTLYPFVGNYWQRLMGVSTRQFGNGAAMQYKWTGGSSYQNPTWTYDVF